VQEKNHLSSHIGDRLFNVFLRFALVLEPLAPPVISYFLSRRLSQLKQQGKISEYNAQTKRLGKFHYNIQIDLDLTGEQAFHVVDDMLPKQLKHIRR
jgi:hypothetical protein